MFENWSEIIEIMKPVIDHKRSRAEIKMALESSLRTLGWRTSKGSMKNDFISKSGKTIDIVLGSKGVDNIFQAILPIQVALEQSEEVVIKDISSIMADIDVKIAIIAGASLELFYFDDVQKQAIRIGEVALELDNEDGVKLISLLAARDFNENNLTEYFESRYKEILPKAKLNSIIRGIIEDKSKAEEVLRLYLEFEGYEGEMVDKALENIGINIFYKSDIAVNPNIEPQSSSIPSQNKTSHDNTRFSLNGGDFLSKKKFVLSVVAEYIKDNPLITLDELESRFPSEIISKVRGVVRTWAQVKSWAAENGPDILTRYSTKEDERITLHDGTEIVVNNQWGAKTFPRFLAIAKQIYEVSSDAPYEDVEYKPRNNKQPENPSSNRAKNFRFSMAGIKIGETIVFNPTKVIVKVVSDDSIEYNGQNYRLSTFVRTFLPDNMRTPSDSYRGPDFFTYNGESLTKLRNSKTSEVSQSSSEDNSDEKNNGIHISLHSFNSFKTKK